MATMAAEELSERVGEVLARVEAGEDVFITVDGREVARVTQVGTPRQVPKGAPFADVRRVQADSRLQTVLGERAPDTSDGLQKL